MALIFKIDRIDEITKLSVPSEIFTDFVSAKIAFDIIASDRTKSNCTLTDSDGNIIILVTRNI